MLKTIAKHFRPLAVLWLLIISVLFVLPGSSLPKSGWLDTIYFDKWVHFGFFALLLFLWRFYFPVSGKFHLMLLLMALLYGFAVEMVQHHFVANRSFDIGDLAADMVGAVTGVWIWGWYKKNRPL
jgi:VanZ family protein